MSASTKELVPIKGLLNNSEFGCHTKLVGECVASAQSVWLRRRSLHGNVHNSTVTPQNLYAYVVDFLGVPNGDECENHDGLHF